MKYFCDKYGKECPNETPRAQSYNCDAWDPRDFLADKTCRHALTVDNMELAIQQWLAANKNITGRKKRIETPERKPVMKGSTLETSLPPMQATAGFSGSRRSAQAAAR